MTEKPYELKAALCGGCVARSEGVLMDIFADTARDGIKLFPLEAKPGKEYAMLVQIQERDKVGECRCH